MSNKKWLVLILHVIAYIEHSEFSKPCNFGRKSNRNQIDISVFKANQCDMVQIKRMLLDFYATYYKHIVYTHISPESEVCLWFWLLVNYKLLVLCLMAVANITCY